MLRNGLAPSGTKFTRLLDFPFWGSIALKEVPILSGTPTRELVSRVTSGIYTAVTKTAVTKQRS